MANFNLNTGLQELKQFINDKCLIVDKEFTLSTGTKANWYFDCKQATLHGKHVITIADNFLAIIDKLEDIPTAISGLTMGADPLITAVSIRASQTDREIVNGAIVRKEPKKHGSKNHIENDQGQGTRVVVVDDVITTGGSTAKACDYLIEAGYRISAIISLIDREAGGATSLAERYNCDVFSLFKKSEFDKIKEFEGNTDEDSTDGTKNSSERSVAVA